jgi:hypothetical protein
MAGEDKFGRKPGATLRCEEWEALLADALDGLLPAKEAAAFTAHSESCANCGDLLAHAQRGREWLVYLHEEPAVPSGLLGKILEKTAGAGAMPLPVPAVAGAGAGVVAMPWRRSFHETRLLMTVAMAFFSIALTLNLAGVKLTSLRLADLRPSQIGSTLSRQFYSGWGSVVRFYDNARFVYQLESRVRELRRDVEQQPQQQQQQQKPNQQQPSKPGGSSMASPDQDLMLNAGGEGAGHRPQAAIELAADSGQPAEQSTELRAQGAEEQETEVSSLAVNRNCISLDHQRAGLREANEGRGLV